MLCERCEFISLCLRRRLRSAGNGRESLNSSEPAAAPVDAAPAPSTRMNRNSNKSRIAKIKVSNYAFLVKNNNTTVRDDFWRLTSTIMLKQKFFTYPNFQSTRSRDSAAVPSSRTERDRHSRLRARNGPAVNQNIHYAPIVPPAGRKNRRQVQQERAANARRGQREK